MDINGVILVVTDYYNRVVEKIAGGLWYLFGKLEGTFNSFVNSSEVKVEDNPSELIDDNYLPDELKANKGGK